MIAGLHQVTAVFHVPTAFAEHLAAAPDEQSRAARAALLRRFLVKLDVDPGGCWRWRGATAGGNRPWDRGGPYGQMMIDGKHVYIHRLSLTLAGRPCPGPGYVPHHWCRVRLCGNYDHLAWVTVEENTRLSNECSDVIPF